MRENKLFSLIVVSILGLLGLFGRTQAVAAITFKVLDFNTWLLWPVAENIEERVRAMPARLAATGADIITLQEVWSLDHKHEIIRAAERYGYSYAYHSEPSFELPLGNGLLILSKYELFNRPEDSLGRMVFSVNTRLDENLVLKGAIHTLVNIPSFGYVDLWNSHLGAISFNASTRSFESTEQQAQYVQIRELLNYMRMSRVVRHGILGIDANAHQLQWNPSRRRFYRDVLNPNYFALRHGSGMTDVYHFFHSPWGSQGQTIGTFMSSNRNVSTGHFGDAPDDQEDYIFATPNLPGVWEAVSAEIVLTENLPETRRPLSDHYGVLTTFRVQAPQIPMTSIQTRVEFAK